MRQAFLHAAVIINALMKLFVKVIKIWETIVMLIVNVKPNFVNFIAVTQEADLMISTEFLTFLSE